MANMKKDDVKTDHAEVVSIENTSPEDVRRLLAEVADLKAKLRISEESRTEAQQGALESAEAQSMMLAREIREIPTGKTVKVQRCDHYEVKGYKDDGREVRKPVFKTVELPTFYYKIELPPVGGEGLVTNGLSLYHGTVYELDIDTLRSVKERVYRLWDHEANIHGTDENIYRKPTRTTLSGRAGGA